MNQDDSTPTSEDIQKTRFLVGCLVVVALIGCAGMLALTPMSNLLIMFVGK